jgi:hypothetical protein
MKNRASGGWLVTVVSVVGCYASVFTWCWLKSPSRTELMNGIEVHYVEFHYNSLLWYTRPIWTPAFWFVEHVLKYRLVAEAPGGKDSVEVFAK